MQAQLNFLCNRYHFIFIYKRHSFEPLYFKPLAYSRHPVKQYQCCFLIVTLKNTHEVSVNAKENFCKLPQTFTAQKKNIRSTNCHLFTLRTVEITWKQISRLGSEDNKY